ERRTWTTYNYTALWVGMSHCIPTYLLASGLIALGMNWVQALITIALANLIVLVPMLLNSHAGTKYGIPYPVFARASFGLRGANLPAVLRALVACAWFGIQTWIGGEGFYILIGAVAGNGWTHATPIIGGYPWTQWLSFALFWVLEMAIIVRGMDTLRRFENWAAPIVLVAAVALLIYMVAKAHGFSAVLSGPAKLGWGSGFWPVFFPALMSMIAFWSTLSLNMPDFTRFSRGQHQQAVGQALGLPTTMTFFSLLAVLITAASQKIYGTPIWDPIQLTGKFQNPVVIAVALMAASWLIRRTELRLADLYRPHGAYWYGGGWNWRALVAFGAGALLAVGGAWSSPGNGPFPSGGLIPALKPLYDYNWVVG